MVKEHDEVEVDLVRVMQDGRGVAWAPDGTLMVIDGIRPGDGRVAVQIQRVYHETAFGKVLRHVREAVPPEPRGRTVESPYEIEEEEGEEDTESEGED